MALWPRKTAAQGQPFNQKGEGRQAAVSAAHRAPHRSGGACQRAGGGRTEPVGARPAMCRNVMRPLLRS